MASGATTRAKTMRTPSVARSQPSTALARRLPDPSRSSAATRAGTITAWTEPAANSSKRMFGTRLAVS